MRQRIGSIGIITLLLVTILAGCGGGSSPAPTATVVTTENTEPTATVVMTDNVEPTGDAPDDVFIPTNPPETHVPMPTSTLYAEDQPTPTAIADATCSYRNAAALTFDTFEQQRGELHACNKLFTWPAGYEIDPEKIAFQPGADTTVGSESGFGRLAIGESNACAWATYWADTTKMGDQEAADEALRYMLTIYSTWTNENPASDEMLGYYGEMLDKAALGDPSALMQFVSSDNCAFHQTFRVNP